MPGGDRREGRCLCGAVGFEFALPTLFCGHCHCSMCRRSHGAAYVTWVGVARAGFRWLRGADALIRYPSSDHGTRSFCGRCGSSLLFESTRRPEVVDVVLANVEGRIDRPPQLHVHFDDRADWTLVGDALPRLGGPTGMEPLD
ncbi:MAG: GFA family protein [Deltaproteobacteria bacterium]|nr:MAG: GFA family protein [Deltaproteobacteria bacterium]